MPHQCTSCGRTFPDGSKEMLSGCPDCGGNKFQFQPKGSSTGDEPPTPTGDESPTPTGDEPPAPTGDESPTSTDQPTAADDSDVPTEPVTAGQSPQPDSAQSESSSTRPTQSPPSDTAPTSDSEHVDDSATEDTAQASARSDVVSPDELERASQDTDSTSAADTSNSGAESGPHSDIDQLRDELNEQFESIRIVSPGTYELNLMELYDRQEYIISLQEDGRYVIEMPDAWGISDE